MGKVNEYILGKAVEAGICEEWAKKIGMATGRGELLAMYCRGIDFCLQKNFPSNKDLVRFGGNDLAKHGIYVDEETALKNSEFAVLLGASKGRFTIDGFTTSQIFVKHCSTAEIDIYDNSFSVIDCFDDTQTTLNAYGVSKILINVYGNASITFGKETSAMVKIIHKNKATY